MVKAIFVIFGLVFTNNVLAVGVVAKQDYAPIYVPDDVQVMISGNTYLVSNVSVSGVAENDNQAFDNSLYQAKMIAFRALKNKIQDSFLPEDSDVVDSAMVGFVPVSGTFDIPQYASKFEILFDKDKIASLITEYKILGQQKARSGSESIVARIAIKNDISTWVKVRKRLDSSGIKYTVVSLSLNEVEIMFKNVNAIKLTKDLKDAKLDLLQNRDFYFIAIPIFS